MRGTQNRPVDVTSWLTKINGAFAGRKRKKLQLTEVVLVPMLDREREREKHRQTEQGGRIERGIER